MQRMKELKEMLCEELDEFARKGELSTGSLDAIDKLTHSIKSIDAIMAMEDAGYSYEGGSYARGRGARRDSMGRYSNNSYDTYAHGGKGNGGSYRYGSYDSGSYERGYSREDAKEELAMGLMELKSKHQDPETSRMIDQWMEQL